VLGAEEAEEPDVLLTVLNVIGEELTSWLHVWEWEEVEQ